MNAVRRTGRKVAGLLVLIGLCAAVFVVLFRFAGGDLPGRDVYRVQTVVPTAVALSPNADVRSAGVKIGKVGTISNRGATAVIELELERKYAPVYRNARVLVRLKTLAGENYVEVDLGHVRAGKVPDGGELPISQADEVTQLDEILSTLDAKTQRRVRRLLDGLGGGLASGGDDLNRIYSTSNTLVTEGGPVVQQLRRQRGQVAALIDDFGRVTRAIGDRTQAARLLARRGKVAAEAAASRDRRIGEVVAELPSTLRQVRGTSTRLGSFSDNATPIFRDLRLATEDLGPVMTELGPAAKTTRSTMVELKRFAPLAEPLLARLTDFAASGTKTVRPLARFLREASPLLSYLIPYGPELGAIAANLKSTVGARDELGNLARIQGVAGETAATGLPPELTDAYKALVEAGLIAEVRGPTRNNAYPPPGSIDHPPAFSGEYQRLEPLPKIGD